MKGQRVALRSSHWVSLLLAVCGWLASAQIAAAQTSYLYLDSRPGDYIGQGITRTITTTDAVFSAARNTDNGVTVTVNGGAANSWTLDFAAPNDAVLALGAYENAERFPFQSPTRPGLSVTGQGRGCNTLTGRFDIVAVTYAADGTPSSFIANFEQHCEGATNPALFGVIVFNVTVPPTFTLTVNRVGPGTVTSSPAGINCGADCTESYSLGTSVTLTATPDPGVSFLGWTGAADCEDGVINRNVSITCTATFGIVQPPGVPNNVTVGISFGTIATVVWAPPTTGGTPTGYRVEILEASGRFTISYNSPGTTVTSMTLSFLPAGTYLAQVRAYNAAGFGPASLPFGPFVIGGITGAPTNFRAQVSGNNVTFSWGPPTSGVTPSFYRLELGVPGNELITFFDVVGGTNFTTTLANATYVARVRASVSGVAGTFTPDIQFVVGPTSTGPVPYAPSDLRFELQGRTVTLSWNHRTDSPAATSFIVEAGSAFGLQDLAWVEIGNGSTRQATFTNIPDGTYYVRLRARNQHGVSYVPSNEVTIAVPAATGCTSPLDAPRSLGATIAGNVVTLSWTAPSTLPTSRPVTSYILQVGTAPGVSNIANFATNNTLTVFSTVAPPGDYFVRVRAQDVCGQSGPSNEIRIIVP